MLDSFFSQQLSLGRFNRRYTKYVNAGSCFCLLQIQICKATPQILPEMVRPRMQNTLLLLQGWCTLNSNSELSRRLGNYFLRNHMSFPSFTIICIRGTSRGPNLKQVLSMYVHQHTTEGKHYSEELSLAS